MDLGGTSKPWTASFARHHIPEILANFAGYAPPGVLEGLLEAHADRGGLRATFTRVSDHLVERPELCSLNLTCNTVHHAEDAAVGRRICATCDTLAVLCRETTCEVPELGRLTARLERWTWRRLELPEGMAAEPLVASFNGYGGDRAPVLYGAETVGQIVDLREHEGQAWAFIGWSIPSCRRPVKLVATLRFPTGIAAAEGEVVELPPSLDDLTWSELLPEPGMWITEDTKMTPVIFDALLKAHGGAGRTIAPPIKVVDVEQHLGIITCLRLDHRGRMLALVSWAVPRQHRPTALWMGLQVGGAGVERIGVVFAGRVGGLIRGVMDDAPATRRNPR